MIGKLIKKVLLFIFIYLLNFTSKFREILIKILRIFEIENSKTKYIKITSDKEFKIKKFSSVNFNFNVEFYKLLIEEIVFKEDFNRTIIAGGVFSNYHSNCFTIEFPILFDIISNKKDIDIFIETNEISKYIMKYSQIIGKISEYYEYISHLGYPFTLFSIKFVWKNLNINIIFVRNNMEIIEKFDFDFCKIFYSYKNNSIYVYQTLLESFETIKFKMEDDLSPNFLNYYQKSLVDMRKLSLNSKEDIYSIEFIRFKLFRYVKYAFKGFYNKEEEIIVKNIIGYYEQVLIKFLSENGF